MQAIRDAAQDEVEILPVVVVTRAFPARPSAVPDIRDFVRQQLAQTALPGDNVRALDQRVADVLLEAAGAGGTIQVSLRIFGNHAEVDVLQTSEGEEAGSTGATNPAARPASADAAPNGGPLPTAGAAPDSGPFPAVGAAPSGVGPRPRPADGGAHRPGVPFPEWLADAIRREGMTMEAAARELRVSVKTVSRWVRGATEPRLCDLSRIRETFGELPFP